MSNPFTPLALALALTLPLAAAPGTTRRGPQRPVNLNTATVTELMQLPRVGAKTAERILAFRILSQGTATTTIISPQEFFREALRYGATTALAFHNHPSGDPAPSREETSSSPDASRPPASPWASPWRTTSSWALIATAAFERPRGGTSKGNTVRGPALRAHPRAPAPPRPLAAKPLVG